MASPATAISHGGHPWWLAVNESSRGLRRSGAGITPESSPACRGFCFSRTLAGLWPPLVVAVLCRRRSPASAGFPSAQPIYQRNFCQLFLKRDHVLYIYWWLAHFQRITDWYFNPNHYINMILIILIIYNNNRLIIILLKH